jgi:hypothetical protein
MEDSVTTFELGKERMIVEKHIQRTAMRDIGALYRDQ